MLTRQMQSSASGTSERRRHRRAPVNLWFNKYVDGVPHLWQILELSMTGALIRNVSGPVAERASYAMELASSADMGATENRLWLCATPVWQAGPYEALEFVGQSRMDKLKLATILEALAAA